ncbi:hypothetical protein EVAR_13396_1 [Eumeta japonica]|uniref:Uncharacterized protein n=1 Tax=Eumeta variegata TaxID=151549 RepID=A0A4C1V5Z1_EUMVA|nr:hypothetical protein EVAR_13396_1 [Eumeta japonica]
MKLHPHGVESRTLDLLASYLTDRSQRVDVNDIRSSGSVVRMRVLQGSILARRGPEARLETAAGVEIESKQTEETKIILTAGLKLKSLAWPESQ